MRIHYGYSDGTGEYRITIDSALCDGCEKCVPVCPEGLFVVAPDDTDIDRDLPVAKIQDQLAKEIGYRCPGYAACRSKIGVTCHEACSTNAISHSW